jgi:YD repeat-containing protein
MVATPLVGAGQPGATQKVKPALASSARPSASLVQAGAPPASNLPDLDSIRNLQPINPQAPPPIPSTRCSPSTPGCNGSAAWNRPSGAEPRPSQLKDRLLNQLAWNPTVPTLDALFSTDRAAVSDSAPSLLGPPRTLRAAVRTASTIQSGGDYSLSLNGSNSYFTVPNSASINLTTAFTAEAWVKLNTSTGVYQSIYERYGQPDANGNNGGFYFRVKPDGRLEFVVNKSIQSGYGVSGNTLVTSGMWHHVAAVDDGIQLRIYLDGALDASLSVSTYPATGTTSLFVGSGNWGGGRINGLIDEARLTASALYNSSFVPETHLTAGANTRGLWKFDDQTASDSSGNYNYGTLMGGTAFSTDVPTLGDYSVSLNGTTGQVRVPYNPSLDVTGPFTVETWFKITDTNTNQYLVSCLTGNGGYILMANDGMPQLYVTNGAGQSDFVIAWPPNITFGAWNHMAGVADGSQIRVYLNGALVASKNSTVTPGSFAGSQLAMGGYQDGASALVNGSMDEVRVSSGALYTSNFTPQAHLMAEASTKGLWKFDGQTTNDFSANGNHATRYGAASYSIDVPFTNQPPAVNVTSPVHNAVFVNDSNITIAANASDGDGTVSKVEFYQGSTKLGEDATAPYQYVWNNVTAGDYTLTAKATDNSGAATISSAVNITVTPPLVSVTATDANASEQGADNGTFTIARTGGTSAPLAVSYALTGTAISGTDYATLSGSLTIPAGSASQTVTVTPTDDAAVEGNETIILSLSNSAAYTISAPASAIVSVLDNDTNPPAVSITTPANNALFSAQNSITIHANASDSDGSISKVEFYQGTTKLGEDANAPYTCEWPNVAAGTYSLTAKATDNAGAITTSSVVNVSVNGPPSVSINGPVANASFSAGSDVTISALASDADGTVAKVEFFQGAIKLGEDTTAPYSFVWSSVPVGGHSLTAVATDNLGLTATSSARSVSVVDFTGARLDAANRTGSTDLFSRNFNWSVPLVSLPGRAGLDLGLSLSYNSLAWVKSGSSMLFDPDRGFPTPGFRFGFPVIQGPYRNTNVPGGVNVFILITPSGGRVELRQVGTSNAYEATDSSYVRLEHVGADTMVLKPSDGTRLTYLLLNGQYECMEVKDRNGNYITIGYNQSGRLSTVTDTLGRVVNVNYDAYQNPLSITQARTINGQSQTHTWATFGYQNLVVDTVFHDENSQPMSAFGVVAGNPIPVLSQVGLDDGTRYTFNYNTRGQVENITRSAQNAGGQWVEMSGTSYTLAANDTDCPRFTESAVRAKDWNDNLPVIIAYSVEGDMQVITLPDGTKHKARYETAGWQRGLVTRTETWGTGANNSFGLRRWTTTEWAQDDQTLVYQFNPRVMRTVVGDPEGNQKRTEVEYLTAQESQFRLPKKVSEFSGTDTTPLRYVETIYELGAIYTGQGLIGLVRERRLKDAQNILQSRIEYLYDTGGDCMATQTTAQAAAPQHDASYNQNYIQGRALQCVVRRHNTGTIDANNPAYVEHRTNYDTFGASVASVDQLGHRNSVSYQDSFSDNNNARNTFAYPSAVTDADQNALPEAERKRSTVVYNFDTGAIVSSTDVNGSSQVNEYDSARRPIRSTRRDASSNVDRGYTRRVYSPTQDFILTLTQIEEATQATAEKVAYAVQVLDGAGQVRAAASLLPGSAGGYRGQHIVSNKLGQVVKQSNPVEITNTWTATGDDAPPNGTGWVYNLQSYDWKGRPLISTNVDGTTTEAMYGGCGCAGGEVVTTRDEVGRRQKTTYDVFGRPRKSEALFVQPKTEALNGEGAIDTTTVNTYDARDHITGVMQYQGAATSDNSCPANTCQQTTLSYDGHGRLASRKAPSESAPTTYIYHADDTTQTVTDARGATSAFTYNARHLVSGVTYGAPANASPVVAVAPPVSFAYDAAGNRKWMVDGVGRVDYLYDNHSRLREEKRHFNGLTNPTSADGDYKLSYDYNVAGDVKSIIDPFGAQVGYTYDADGSLNGVTGGGFANVTQYASGIRRRASGGVKALTYGNGHTLSMSYDPRLQVASYEIPNVIKKEYQYHPDARLKFVEDLLDNKFDRSYSYDHTGRLSQALSGAEARGEGETTDRPYNQNFQYDSMGHLKMRSSINWEAPTSFTHTYVNDRNTLWEYDAAGNVTKDQEFRYTLDAAGQVRNVDSLSTVQNPIVGKDPSSTTSSTDGDGLQVKTTNTVFELRTQFQHTTTTYYVRSSMLGGQVVSEVTASGSRQRGFVYAGSEVLAWQEVENGVEQVVWEHRDAADTSFRTSNSQGFTTGNGILGQPAELDPTGNNAGLVNPIVINPDGPPPEGTGSLVPYPTHGTPAQRQSSYTVFGMPVSYDIFMMFYNALPSGHLSLLYASTRMTYHRRIGRGIDSKWVETALTPSPSLSLLFGQQNKIDPEDTVDKAIAEAAKLLKQQNCLNFLGKSSFGKDGKEKGLGLGDNVSAKIMEAISGVPHRFILNENHRLGANVTNEAVQGSHLNFYRSFFWAPRPAQESGGMQATVIMTAPQDRPRTLTDQAQILVHEALHLMGSGGDIELANRLGGKFKTDLTGDKKDQEQTKASRYLQEKVAKYCK